VQRGGHVLDRGGDLADAAGQPAGLGPDDRQLLLGRLVLSGVDSTVTRIDPIEQTAPSMNDPNTQYGMPAAVVPARIFSNTNSDRLASVIPRPVKNDWVRNPLASWASLSLSARNAR